MKNAVAPTTILTRSGMVEFALAILFAGTIAAISVAILWFNLR